jgi:hypothetical protein
MTRTQAQRAFTSRNVAITAYLHNLAVSWEQYQRDTGAVVSDEWILVNQEAGFPVGIHSGHFTSYEPDVAVVDATGEMVHYCHYCESFANAAQIRKA